jgi:thioredoxin 2
MISACPSCGTKNRIRAERLHERAECGKCHAAISPPDHPLPFGSPEEFDGVIASSSLPVLVDFWAAWCGPCRVVAPELEKLARERAGKLVVAKVDTEALPSVAARFNIYSIPTLILFAGGREEKRVSGAMPASAIASAFGL